MSVPQPPPVGRGLRRATVDTVTRVARGTRLASGRGDSRNGRHVGPIRMRYGPARGQRADLWLPAPPPAQLIARPAGAGVPVVVLLHGGFWAWPYTKVLMTGLARDVRARGWAAWNVEYRRLGRLGGDGGYPATFDDVAAAVDHLARLPEAIGDRLDLTRVVLCGHSAGGTLALWAAGQTGGAVAIRGAIGLAPVADLAEAERRGIGGAAIARLLGGRAKERPERYAACSPAERGPCPVPVVLVHGRKDATVPVGMSEEHVARQQQAGGDAELVVVDATHRSLLRHRGPGWVAVTRRIATLSEHDVT